MIQEVKNKKNKLKIQRNLIKVLMGPIAISTTVASANQLTSQIPPVCDAVFEYVLESSGLTLEQFLNLQDPIGTLLENRDESAILTQKDLHGVRFLYLDVLNTRIQDLQELPRLKELYLANYIYLSDEEKATLKGLSNLDTIALEIDSSSVTNMEMYDTSFINDNTNIVFNIPATGLSDFEKLFYYIAKKNFEDKPRIVFNGLTTNDIQILTRFEDMLKDIVSGFNFDENTTDREKIIEITKYVTNFIEYDLVVSNNEDSLERRNKINEYNEFPLGTILAENSNKEGVCCNYAALESALGYYLGIDLDYVTSAAIDGSSSHAWNIYKENKTKYSIDPTNLDDNNNYNKLKELYDKTNGFTINIPGLEKDLEDYKKWYEDTIFRDKPFVEVMEPYVPHRVITFKKFLSRLKYNEQKRKLSRYYAISSLVVIIFLASNIYFEKKTKEK